MRINSPLYQFVDTAKHIFQNNTRYNYAYYTHICCKNQTKFVEYVKLTAFAIFSKNYFTKTKSHCIILA